jgi:hypothetical protein
VRSDFDAGAAHRAQTITAHNYRPLAMRCQHQIAAALKILHTVCLGAKIRWRIEVATIRQLAIAEALPETWPVRPP